MTKKLLFIYNPHSGKARIKSNLLDIIDILVKFGYEVTAYPTQCRSDAERAVTDRHDGYDLIVCSGGDGTLNEVVSGMMRSRVRIPIGYIPSGSTNDFAKSLKIPGYMIPAARIITDGHIFRSDIGELCGEFYAYVAAFGIFTEVTYATPQNIKNTLGYSAYILEAIRSLPTIRAYHMHVKWEDGEIEDDFIYGMITNSISVGGFKGITGHHVQLDDGFHEVTLIKNPTTPMELSDIVRAMVDRRMDSANIITFKSRHVELISPDPVRWTRDGEFGGEHTRAEITVHPHALDIIVPDQ